MKVQFKQLLRIVKPSFKSHTLTQGLYGKVIVKQRCSVLKDMSAAGTITLLRNTLQPQWDLREQSRNGLVQENGLCQFRKKHLLVTKRCTTLKGPLVGKLSFLIDE